MTIAVSISFPQLVLALCPFAWNRDGFVVVTLVDTIPPGYWTLVQWPPHGSRAGTRAGERRQESLAPAAVVA
jgi:hypothetical protein